MRERGRKKKYERRKHRVCSANQICDILKLSSLIGLTNFEEHDVLKINGRRQQFNSLNCSFETTKNRFSFKFLKNTCTFNHIFKSRYEKGKKMKDIETIKEKTKFKRS